MATKSKAFRERLSAPLALAGMALPLACIAAMMAENSAVRVEADAPPVAAAVAVDDDVHLLVTNAGATAGVRVRPAAPGWRLVEPSEGAARLSVGGPVFYKVVEEADREAVKSGWIRMFAADFAVASDMPSGAYPLSGALTDNQRATVSLRLSGISSLRGHSASMSVRPEQAAGVVNKMGTSVSVAADVSSLEWRTTKVYWYGVNPGGCCYYRRFNYVFDLTVDGVRCASRKYDVGWPDESPRMEYNIEALRHSSSSVSDVEEVFETNGNWRAKITFAPFARKTGRIYDCPASSQYAAEIGEEEMFHKKQWEASVPVEQGGSGDCFTVRGLRWFAQRNSICITLAHGDYVYGESRDDAYQKAWRLVLDSEAREVEKSRSIYRDRRGFREWKAKEHAGYNAAFKYHCTYQDKYGESPTNIVHDAYR